MHLSRLFTVRRLAFTSLAVALAACTSPLFDVTYSKNGFKARPVASVTDSEGNLYVAGERFATRGGETDLLVVKYDKAGNILWEYVYKSPYPGGEFELPHDRANAIALDSRGSVYIVGETYAPDQGEYGYSNNRDWLVARLDAYSGQQLWLKIEDGGVNGPDEAHALAVDPSRNQVYVTGTRRVTPHDALQTTQAYDANGTLVWSRALGTVGNRDFSNDGKAIALAADGSVTVAGNIEYDASVVRYDANGNQLWLKTWRRHSYAWPAWFSKLSLDSAGNAYAFGTAWGSETLDKQAELVKFDANGNQLWQTAYGSSDRGNEQAQDIAWSNGKLYISHSQGHPGEDTSLKTWHDNVTLRIDPANGQTVWRKLFSAGSNQDDRYARFYVDPANGNLRTLISSFSNAGGGQENYTGNVLNYAAADGAELSRTTVSNAYGIAINDGPDQSFYVAGVKKVGILPDEHTMEVARFAK